MFYSIILVLYLDCIFVFSYSYFISYFVIFYAAVRIKFPLGDKQVAIHPYTNNTIKHSQQSTFINVTSQYCIVYLLAEDSR